MDVSGINRVPQLNSPVFSMYGSVSKKTIFWTCIQLYLSKSVKTFRFQKLAFAGCDKQPILRNV